MKLMKEGTAFLQTVVPLHLFLTGRQVLLFSAGMTVCFFSLHFSEAGNDPRHYVLHEKEKVNKETLLPPLCSLFLCPLTPPPLACPGCVCSLTPYGMAACCQCVVLHC